jgi:DNA invertase Pin-like site-specific DNA recombinase
MIPWASDSQKAVSNWSQNMTRLLSYARVSTSDQDLALQLHALQAADVAEENSLTDVLIGGSADRHRLAALLAAAQAATRSSSGD